jgi:hypothetical protein
MKPVVPYSPVPDDSFAPYFDKQSGIQIVDLARKLNDSYSEIFNISTTFINRRFVYLDSYFD